MYRQIEQLEKANAPKEEIDLIARSWDMQSKLYSQALNDLDNIINVINKQLNTSIEVLINDDITEEKINTEYWQKIKEFRLKNDDSN
jgi:hypothetical protein